MVETQMHEFNKALCQNYLQPDLVKSNLIYVF